MTRSPYAHIVDEALADGIIDAIPPRGLPRPLDDGLPIPFAVSQSWQGVLWAQINTKLTMLATLAQMCHVCGDPLDDDDAWAFLDAMGRAVDGWAMHERCAKLAKAHCPFLRDGAESSEVFAAPAADVAMKMRAFQLRKLIASG